MLEYDFNHSVGYWTKMAADAFFHQLETELRPHGITWRQCQVLGLLALAGKPLSQAELAQGMGIEPPTLVGILDRMERDGWIERQSCPGDRRKKQVVNTAAAEPVWAKIVTCAKRVRQRATRGMSPAEVSTLRRLLERIQDNLQVRPVDEVA